jgi:hypothetical protein
MRPCRRPERDLQLGYPPVLGQEERLNIGAYVAPSMALESSPGGASVT